MNKNRLEKKADFVQILQNCPNMPNCKKFRMIIILSVFGNKFFDEREKIQKIQKKCGVFY